MAQKSYRVLYAAVKRMPQELVAFSRRIKSTNLRMILAGLRDSPSKWRMGDYLWGRRLVRLRNRISWDKHGYGPVAVISPAAIVTATQSINRVMKKEGLPFAVWVSFRSGGRDTQVHNPRAPFLLGLVDLQKNL